MVQQKVAVAFSQCWWKVKSHLRLMSPLTRPETIDTVHLVLEMRRFASWRGGYHQSPVKSYYGSLKWNMLQITYSIDSEAGTSPSLRISQALIKAIISTSQIYFKQLPCHLNFGSSILNILNPPKFPAVFEPFSKRQKSPLPHLRPVDVRRSGGTTSTPSSRNWSPAYQSLSGESVGGSYQMGP